MSDTFTIEKGIPTPASKGRSYKYPWANMKVGDSVSFSGYAATTAARAAAYAWAARHPGFKIATQRTKDGVRIWRVKAPETVYGEKGG